MLETKCSVKTEAVRMQELSLAAEDARSSPKRKLQVGPAPAGLTLYGDAPAERKRGKRALSAGVERSRNADVQVEGPLVVAEQVDRQGAAIFRTLGSIHCVLVRKRGSMFLETVASDSHHMIQLDLDAVELVHEPFQRDRKFQLRYRSGELSSSGRLRAESYAFMATTQDEYSAWVAGIQAWQARQTTGGGNSRDSRAADEKNAATNAGSIRGRQSRETSSKAPEQQSPRPNGPQHQTQPSIGDFVYSSPPQMKHFILIRHGHYINAHVPQVSDSQQVLSQMGRQQAGLTGKYLGNILSRIPTRHDVSIYHSDMTRAVETAAIIGNDVGEVTLNASRLLREGWPGTPYSTDFPVGGEAAARNNTAFSAAMQERGRLDSERMEKAFTWFFSAAGEAHEENEEESYCVLVCHANLIRFFLCRALGVDPESTWGHFEINHCGVTRIDVCANRPIKVVAVNETGHLPQSLITSSEDHL